MIRSGRIWLKSIRERDTETPLESTLPSWRLAQEATEDSLFSRAQDLES